jgi:hypothetical protein
MTDLLSALERWQTLIAGGLAIVAAFIGGAHIMRQIAASERQETARTLAKFNASRAVLPLTLSYVSAYGHSSAKALGLIYAQRVGEDVPSHFDMPEFPQLPKDALFQLRDIVEFGAAQIGEAVATLLAKIQVHQSRTIGLKDRREEPGVHAFTVSDIEQRMLDAAEIFARAAALFDYARRRSEIVPTGFGAAQMQRALNNLGFYSDDFRGLHNAASERAYA